MWTEPTYYMPKHARFKRNQNNKSKEQEELKKHWHKYICIFFNNILILIMVFNSSWRFMNHLEARFCIIYICVCWLRIRVHINVYFGPWLAWQICIVIFSADESWPSRQCQLGPCPLSSTICIFVELLITFMEIQWMSSPYIILKMIAVTKAMSSIGHFKHML